MVLYLVVGLGHPNLGFGSWNICGWSSQLNECKLNMVFISFFAIFDDVSK